MFVNPPFFQIFEFFKQIIIASWACLHLGLIVNVETFLYILLCKCVIKATNKGEKCMFVISHEAANTYPKGGRGIHDTGYPQFPKLG